MADISQLLFSLTLLQIWWIAVWGLFDLTMRRFVGHKPLNHFIIYLVCMAAIYTYLLADPSSVIHL
jgi:hypothetical protein